MDSPESTTGGDAVVNAPDPTSNSPSVQESPFSNFVSSFSPLDFKNVTRMSQGFLGLSSPPLIFTTPRANPDRESGFLRSQNAELSMAEASQDDARLNQVPQETGDWDFGMRESSGVNNCEQIQHCSSSEQVDNYLVDPVEGECPESLIDQNLKLSELGFQISKTNENFATDSKGRTMEPENRSAEQAKDDASYILLEPGESKLKARVLFEGRQVKIKEGQSMSELKDDQCVNAEFQDNSKCSNFMNDGSGNPEEINLSSEMVSELMENAQALEDCRDHAELNRPLCDMMLDSEVNQQHRGLSRRCLQFEEALPNAAVNKSGSHVSRDANFSKSTRTSGECNTFDSNASTGSKELINVSQPMDSSASPLDNEKLILPLATASGIGLHLNTIVKSVSVGCDATSSMKMTDGSMSIRERKSEATVDCHLLENKTKITDEYATPHDKRKFSLECPDNSEHCIDQNLKSKKKKLSNVPDEDGCKRCNCKKTKCLKLYCDCFAAGIYCDGSCSCQGCLNRVEYAETVLETRRQVESRNPLAFAPKIIQHGSEKKEAYTTPSSARHKRGCNCKKSMCLKKYCECYQGNVGCSSGCRCENCKNLYGKKDDYVAEDLMSSRAVVEKSELDDNMDIVATRNDSVHAQLNKNMHKLTPTTPLYPHSDHGKGGPKSHIIVRRFHPSHSTTHRNPDDEIPTEDPSRFSSFQNPLTTVPASARWISKKSQEYNDPDTELLNIFKDNDETQEILMEGSTKTPTNVRSPSRKRVSPLKQQRRKFVLRGVPSFPSLTPCSESKMLAKQQQHGSADSQQCSDKL